MKLNVLGLTLFVALVACSTSSKKSKESDSQIKPQEVEKSLEIDELFLRKSQRIGSNLTH